MLLLQRYSDSNQSTLGLLFVNKKFFCYTLEDMYNNVKIPGKTRIPAGRYKLGIRKADTPLTLKYRERYPWFKNHIEVLNVPGFTGIYIHIGNTDRDTDGCILVGDSVNNNTITTGLLSNSTQAFKRLYEHIYPNVENLSIEIRDEIL